VDERRRERWRDASLAELRQALRNGEISEEDYRQILKARRHWDWLVPVLVTVLVTVGLLGLGVLILCGGCALMLTKPKPHP
jgi:hypothetical protein